ncbi:MAG: acylphosphatase [Candidatus Omnitrophica bacterium]|nr:acylphosphatase [Candidatus Omnitrophota bacterium]
MPDKRAHIHYEGFVQGVGFRFAAERAATSMGLSGWARNLGDGRVEVLCEGDERRITGFLEKMAEIFGSQIRNSDIEWSKPTGEFSGFDIRFD